MRTNTVRPYVILVLRTNTVRPYVIYVSRTNGVRPYDMRLNLLRTFTDIHTMPAMIKNNPTMEYG